MAQILNFNDAQSQKRLAADEELRAMELEIMMAEQSLSILRRKLYKRERELLGGTEHAKRCLQRRARKQDW